MAVRGDDRVPQWLHRDRASELPGHLREVLGRACGAPLRAAPGLRVGLCEDMVAVAQCRLEGWGESVHLRSCRECHVHRRP